MSTTERVPQSPPPEPYTSPPITIVLTVILVFFFCIGFFSLYFCRCIMHNLLYMWHAHRSPSGSPVGRGGPCRTLPGIDPSIIQSFPTFTYSTVKDYRREKYGLECAICLCEFEDENMLRLITTCNHVFHQECIDLWFESHKTCPVCRRTLDEPEKSPEKSPAASLTNNSMHEIHQNEPLDDAVSITIKDDNEVDIEKDATHRTQSEEGQGHEHDEDEVGRFSRSKSTGHSIVRAGGGGGDRFTLILPEHLKAKIIKGHNSTKSCTTFGEFKSRTSPGNGGFGEISGGLPGGEVNKV